MTQTEALKQALEWIESTAVYLPTDLDDEGIKVSTAIKEALAQPEQDPVASVYISHHKGLENRDFDYWGSLPDGSHNLYITPPQRKPLSDEEIPEGVLLAIQRAGLTLVMTAHGYHLMNLGLIEAAHGIKGEA